LWLVQSVDTAQAHICYTCNFPNLYKIKFLENLLAGLRGSRISGVCPESPDFLDTPDLTRRLRVVKVYIPLTTVKNSLSPFHNFTVPTSSVSSLSPTPKSLAISTFPPAKLSESEGLKAPRRGDQGSTQDSKDSSLLPSPPRYSNDFFTIYFPRVVLVVSS
jgi:hypothetical protein